MLTYFPGVRYRKRFAQMQRQLMPEKIEVNPGLGAAPFFTSQKITIELAGNLQIADVNSEMKN